MGLTPQEPTPLAEKRVQGCTLFVVQHDITTLAVDAVVTAANRELLGGGGVDGAIHRSGGPQLQDELRAIREEQGGCPTGQAVVTSAGKMPSRYCFHTPGPIWDHHLRDAPELLENCYRSCLDLATKYECKSLAFPNISTGVYGFPKKEAAYTAVDTIQCYLNQYPSPLKTIYLCCWEQENLDLYIDLLSHPQ